MPGLKSSEMIFTLSWTMEASDRVQTITCGATNTSSATAADLLSLWDLATWNNSGVPFRPSNLGDGYTIARSTCTLNRGGIITNAETLPGTVGTSSTPVPSPRVVGNVKKVTGRSNRKYRGRFFMPAGYLTESAVHENGSLDSGLLSDLNGDLSTMYTAMATAGSIPPHILHLKTDEVATLVNSFELQPFVATVRHRQPRA